MDGSQSVFEKLKAFVVHQTNYTTVTLQVVTINEKLYIGFERVTINHRDQTEPPRTKSIFIPVEAYERLLQDKLPKVRQVLQSHQNRVKLQEKLLRAPKKRALENGIFTFLLF